MSLIASECEEHSGLHINSDSLIVEIEKNKELNQDGAGPVIVTDLRNTVMPFIRYKVGDMALISDRECCLRQDLSASFVSSRTYS